MKSFVVCYNPIKDENQKTTKYISEYLEKRNCRVVSFMADKAADIPDDAECVIVVGGDGTVLIAAESVRARNLPIIGINLGALGYLAEVEKNGIDEALNRLMADEFELEERMMLEGRVEGKGQEAQTNWALNDIVISRSGPLMLNRLELSVNGMYLHTYAGDGIIVTTPTGSTGYNLSAGGPLVEPGAKLLMVTPICPHTLNQRSIILSMDDTIEIEVPFGKDGHVQSLLVSFDGNKSISLSTGDKVVIKRAKYSTVFAKLNKISFLDVLHRKMAEK